LKNNCSRKTHTKASIESCETKINGFFAEYDSAFFLCGFPSVSLCFSFGVLVFQCFSVSVFQCFERMIENESESESEEEAEEPRLTEKELAEIDRVRDNTVKKTSKNEYERKERELCAWLLKKGFRNLVRVVDGVNMINTSTFNSEYVKAYEAFLNAIVANPNHGSSMSTLSGYRTAVNNRFSAEDLAMPTEVSRRISKFHSGLKRTVTQEKVDGRQSVTEAGKEPIPFGCYVKTAQYFWSHDLLFEHVFTVLSWNLICRSTNVSGIRLDYMRWFGDALGIYFAVVKSDQEGERPKDPKHIYANPLIPEVIKF